MSHARARARLADDSKVSRLAHLSAKASAVWRCASEYTCSSRSTPRSTRNLRPFSSTSSPSSSGATPRSSDSQDGRGSARSLEGVEGIDDVAVVIGIHAVVQRQRQRPRLEGGGHRELARLEVELLAVIAELG